MLDLSPAEIAARKAENMARKAKTVAHDAAIVAAMAEIAAIDARREADAEAKAKADDANDGPFFMFLRKR
jgi:hypothetical protein